MASAEKIDKDVIVPPPDYSLRLTEEEAEALMAVVGSIGGSHPVRTHLSNIWHVLGKAGVAKYSDNRFFGSFKDLKIE